MDIYNSASSTPNVDRKQNVDCALYKINYCIVYSDCDQICWVGEDRWGGGGGCKKSGSRNLPGLVFDPITTIHPASPETVFPVIKN